MGIGVIAVLSAHIRVGLHEIALAAVAGFVLAIPVSWFAGRQIRKLEGDSQVAH